MVAATQEVVAYQWSEGSAKRSGKSGYRVGVELSGNPFKGTLGEAWIEGWQEARAVDPYLVKKACYAEEPRTNDRRPRTFVKFASRGNCQGTKPKSR